MLNIELVRWVVLVVAVILSGKSYTHVYTQCSTIIGGIASQGHLCYLMCMYKYMASYINVHLIDKLMNKTF